MYLSLRLHNPLPRILPAMLRATLLVSTAAALVFCALLAVPCSSTAPHADTSHDQHHHSSTDHHAAAENHCALHSLVLPAAPAVSSAPLAGLRLTPRPTTLPGGLNTAPPQPPPQDA